MPFINGNVKVEELGHGRWSLLEALNYQGERDLFKVPAGFVTDFASVPGLFTWLVPRYGRFTKAAILHDFLCDEAKEGRFIRSQADGIFRRVMRELCVGFIRRWVTTGAVKECGLSGVWPAQTRKWHHPIWLPPWYVGRGQAGVGLGRLPA
jgi:hypothetical protein